MRAEPDRATSEVTRLDVLAWCAALAFFAAILVRTAWIADDAFVDFRTAANAASGYGLRWNVIERVETFSDPLWMLLLTTAAAATNNVPVAALALNGILTVGAVLIVMSEAEDATRAALAVVALALSRAFVDYSVAGLSDALGYLLRSAARSARRPTIVDVR
jgi:arabinofuranosyltransferase